MEREAVDKHMDQNQRQQIRQTDSSSDNKKKLNSSSSVNKSRGSRNYTVPKPFSLSAEKVIVGKAVVVVDNELSGNAASHKSSSTSRGSQPNSPLAAKKITDLKKNHDEEDAYSTITSSAASTRSRKPKLTVGVAPTFRSTSRLERRKEFYQKLEEKQKALEEEKRENEKRLEEEQQSVTKQIRKSMVYKANPVPNFYYEAPPPKLTLKKFPLTRPKSPNLNFRKSCSDTVNASDQEVKGKYCVRHRHSLGGCKEESKVRNIPRTPNMKKSAKETPSDGEPSENGIHVA